VRDLDFFFDPVCPWAWITSRWVCEVRSERGLDVMWRPISLMILNENQTGVWYTPEYRAIHVAGTQALRVAVAAEERHGNAAVDRLYTEIGERLHPQGRRGELENDPVAFLTDCCRRVDLEADLGEAALDESRDGHLRAETTLALDRTGPDVGTPIMTFRPGRDDEGSFFGPVIARAPRGPEAVALWDAVESLATTSGLAELKRSLRSRPDFT